MVLDLIFIGVRFARKLTPTVTRGAWACSTQGYTGTNQLNGLRIENIYKIALYNKK